MRAKPLKSRKCRRGSAEIRIGREDDRHLPSFDRSTDGSGGAVGPKCEVMVPQSRRIAAQHCQQPQLGSGLASRGSKCRTHAEIAGIQYQDRSQSCGRDLAFGDLGCQTREPATRVIVIQSHRRKVGRRRHAY